MHITAIVFDCFGVLTTDGWLPFFRQHFAGTEQEEVRYLHLQADNGLMHYNDFLQAVGERAGVGTHAARAAIENNVANEELFDYMRTQLKPQYSIGMLSNAAEDWTHTLFAPEDVALFDTVVLSRDVGASKPDPRMYQAVCDRLGVLPEEALFIDDIEAYAAAARECGMHALHHTGDTTTLIQNISEYMTS